MKECQIKASSYASALMVRDGLVGAGIKKLRVTLEEARSLGDPRYTLVTMRMLGQMLIEFARNTGDHDEGRKLLMDALDIAEQKEISYEAKWLSKIIENHK